jgi:hypothetical protein
MRKRLAIILGIAAVFVLVAGAAWASIPGPDGVIHGCRKNTDGSLRAIDSAATCPSGWTALNWQAGPASGTLYGFRHVIQTVDVPNYTTPQTFVFSCSTGEVAISAAAILYRVDGVEYRAEPPTEVGNGTDARFSFINPYTEPTQLQAGYNCVKVSP